MVKLNVIDRLGRSKIVEGALGITMMEAIRDNGFDDLQALCGGCCSCATCHVHIDQEFISALSPVSEEEDELLDSSNHRTKASRLSCQVKLTSQLDSVTVRIAPED